MKDKNILNYVGVFAVALLVAASAVYIYSPVIGSHADEMTAKVSAVVNPVASLTLDTDNLEFNVSPTIEGSFNSGSITASVNTNSLGGYELYFSSEDDETNMTHNNESVTDVIASDFEGTVTNETMGANKWGYSLDNVDFLKIPALSNQATLRDIDHMPDSSEKNNTVYIGTKISTGLTSGSYSKKVVFSVLAHETPEPPVPSMQAFDPSTLSEGESVQLRDARDDNLYIVKKLADGNVWMTENLRIANATITSEDSNLLPGGEFTIPESDENSFSEDYDKDAVFVDENNGGYYSYHTATAGIATSETVISKTNQDICPKGWRLPLGSTSGDYADLIRVYDTSEAMMNDLNLTLSGKKMPGYSEITSLTFGNYWTSYFTEPISVYDSNGESVHRYASSLMIINGNPSNRAREEAYNGLPIRCIAKNDSRTIKDISYMQDINRDMAINTPINTAKTLYDTRDGTYYTVEKMKDGTIWMRKNLRISNVEISSQDSNLPDGASYAVPESNLEAFTRENNTNAMYLDSTYGGYYSYYTATAGLGMIDSYKGQVYGDICPKGWRLPISMGGDLDDYSETAALSYAYPSPDYINSGPRITFSGYVYGGKYKSGQGENVNLWTMTNYTSDKAYALYASSGYSLASYNEYKYYGYSIRCVAK